MPTHLNRSTKTFRSGELLNLFDTATSRISESRKLDDIANQRRDAELISEIDISNGPNMSYFTKRIIAHVTDTTGDISHFQEVSRYVH
jgi:hypothetical protein